MVTVWVARSMTAMSAVAKLRAIAVSSVSLYMLSGFEPFASRMVSVLVAVARSSLSSV
ncbi:hypothetical protein D3C87_2044810 [compost metagenome]